MTHKSYYAIIPADVRYDRDLPANAKLLYGEITALCNEKGYCWATNNYFSELYGVSNRTVTNWISALIDKGYISSRIEYEKGDVKTTKRYLSLISTPIWKKTSEPYGKNIPNPHEENFQHNITSITTINNNRASDDSKSILKKSKKENNKELIEAAERIWKLYPRKKGKQNAMRKLPDLIKKYGEKQIEMCVRRYDLEIYTQETKEEYIKHGSTFFSGGYVDYLDENYKQEDNTEIEEKAEVKEEIEQPKQPEKQEKTIKLEEMF